MTSNNLPLLTTIIPFYNPRFDFFREAIESVLAQSYTNWEVIIVNDGSNYQDKTSLEKYIQSLNNEKIFIIHLPKNSGQTLARNKGIQSSNGEIITFLDSDDFYFPWFYKDIIETYNKHPNCTAVGIWHSYYLSLGKLKILSLSPKLTNEAFQIKHPEEFEQKIKDGEVLLFPRISFKKEIFNSINYSPDIRFNDDIDIFLKIINNNLLIKKVAISYTKSYVYRQYCSKNRLISKANLVFLDKENLINRYNNENLNSYKLIKNAQSSVDYIKFIRHLTNYFNNGNILQYIKEIFINYKSTKDVLFGIRTLIKAIVNYKILLAIFGFDLRYLSLLLRLKENKLTDLKIIFQDYLLKNDSNEESAFYARKLFKKIF